MTNPGKMDTRELGEAVSAEDAMTTMEEGFLEIFYALDENLTKAILEPKYYNEVRRIVRQTIKDIKNELSPDLTVVR